MQPRLIRLRDAPRYLGMDRNRFNAEVRPYLINLRIGQQGIAFDRIDLDNWADNYKQQNGLPVKRSIVRNSNDIPDSLNAVQSDLSTKKFGDKEFQKILEQAMSRK